jgi:hypothetical protein
MLYFNILPEDINIIIESKLNYDTINNFDEVIDINFKQLIILKYSILYKDIYKTFNNPQYKINYEELYKDLLLFKSPPQYLDEKHKKDIISDYNLVISGNMYKNYNQIEPFLNISTLNLFSLLNMYKYNHNVIERLKLYPQINDLARTINDDIIKKWSSKTFLTTFQNRTHLDIIQKYLIEGTISEVIIFEYIDLYLNLDPISLYHFLYLIIKENKTEYIIILDDTEIDFTKNTLNYNIDMEYPDIYDAYTRNWVFYDVLRKCILENLFK